MVENSRKIKESFFGQSGSGNLHAKVSYWYHCSVPVVSPDMDDICRRFGKPSVKARISALSPGPTRRYLEAESKIDQRQSDVWHQAILSGECELRILLRVWVTRRIIMACWHPPWSRRCTSRLSWQEIPWPCHMMIETRACCCWSCLLSWLESRRRRIESCDSKFLVHGLKKIPVDKSLPQLKV